MTTASNKTEYKDVNGYIIYLRKSRQDNPDETIQEVLEKHETMLQEFAIQTFGSKIPESNIYREVVSGESIQDREEMRKVLARLEDPQIKGVIVIEPQRLSRGDLEDCGRLISALQYTKTQVITPYMTYDLENKMERKFFQDELMRGREYLEYTKEILLRGRVAATKRGCYIGNYAPFGYRKIKIGKDHTLEIVEEEAQIVKYIYELFVNGMTTGRIAKKLNEMGINAPRGERWVKSTIKSMVKNRHYRGLVVFNRIKLTTVIEHGERIQKRLAQPEDQIIVCEGKHQAIIDKETWDAAQAIIARNPKTKLNKKLKNPLASILACSNCGQMMNLHPYSHAADRYECRHNPRCFKSIQVQKVDDAVLLALENIELPNLKLKIKNGDGDAVKIQRSLLEKLEKQMQEYRAQEDKQFELLETAMYSQEVFERRNAVLRNKMEECQKQIYHTKSNMPENIDYSERVATLEDAIAVLKDATADADQKNKLLRAIVSRIEYTGTASVGVNRKGQGQKQGDNKFKIKVFLRL